MNDRIKPYVPWINVSLIVSLNFLALYAITNVYSVMPGNSWYYSIISAIAIPGFEISHYILLENISGFGGDQIPISEFLKTVAISVIGIVTLFILATWFFTKGLLSRNADNQPSGVLWYVGTIIVILGITMSTFVGIRNSSISPASKQNEQSIETNRSLDQLRTYMTNVAFDASEWWILPYEKGGGNGSFINGDEALTLSDLEFYNPEHPDFELIIDEILSDSTMIVKGSLINHDVEAESDRHILLEITPMNDSVFKFQTTR
ncbi:MAG: hypothetical protein WD381_00190 [Balneolaceae bacterium]